MSDDFLTDPGKDADGSALRKFAEAQKTRAEQFETELKQLREQVTAQNRKTALDEAKVPEPIRKFYTGEATVDAVKAWIEENKTVFNFGPTDVTDANDATSSDTGNDSIPDAIRQQQERLQQAADLSRDNAGAVGIDGFKAKAEQLMNSGSRPTEADLDKLFGEFIPAGGLTVPRNI